MTLTPRRITVGLVCAAVVAAMTGVTTWALAGDGGARSTTAAPVRLVVGYKDGADRTTAVQTMAAVGASSTVSAAGQQALSAVEATAVQVPAARSTSLIASLKSDPGVAYVEVDHVRKAYEVSPNDPMYTDHLQPEAREVNLPAAWETTTGAAVTVAVLDTGVNAVGDLAGAVQSGYDFVNNDAAPADDFGHGTMVASLIAARAGNDLGMAGVCWACQILPVKVLDSNGSGLDSTIAKGVIWAVQHGAKIINLSLGGDSPSKVLSDAVAYANQNSVLVVAAAGNDATTARSYPAAYPDVVAVGATARCPDFGTDPTCTAGTSERAKFSNYNSAGDRWVDVAAPGIVTAMDRYGNFNTGEPGTSFSSPIVAGIAALIKSRHPEFTGWSLMNAIQQGARSTPVAGDWVSYGKVDAAKSLTVATETTPPTSTGISPAQNAKVRGTVTITPVKIADNYSGIRNVGLYVDGVYKGAAGTAPFSAKWNSAGRNGPVKLQLRIYDKAGNYLSLDRTIIADNTAPAVKITKAPGSGSKITGTVKIFYTGSDKYGVKNYQLLINGKAVQTHTSTASPFAFAAGSYPRSIAVQVRATDVAGNVTLSAKYSYHR